MLRKEFVDVSKHSLYFALLSVIVPLILKIAMWDTSYSYFGLFFIQFQFALLVFSMFMGNSLFLGDRGQRSVDYLFSLPYSRMTILGMKLLPRFVFVVVFWLLALWMNGLSSEGMFFLDAAFYSHLVFILFILGACFSVSSENYFMMMVLTLLPVLLMLPLLYFIILIVSQLTVPIFIPPFEELLRGLRFHRMPLRSSLYMVALLLPFIAAFLQAYRKTGIVPVKDYKKRFGKVFAPVLAVVLVILFAASFIEFNRYQPHYMLTGNEKLLAVTGVSARINDGSGMKTIDNTPLMAFVSSSREDGKHIYSFDNSHQDIDKHVLRLNLETHELENLYDFPYRELIRMSNRLYDGQLMFLLDLRPDGKKLKLVNIDTDSKAVTGVVLEEQPWMHRVFKPELIGTDIDPETGKRFWLAYFWQRSYRGVLRIRDDGSVETIAKSRQWPFYVNRMLVTRDETALVFSKITSNGLEEIKRCPEAKNFNFFRQARQFGWEVAVKGGYGYIYMGPEKPSKKIYFDLDTFEMREIPMFSQKRNTRLFSDSRGNWYGATYKKLKRGFFFTKIYRLEKENALLLKENNEDVPDAGRIHWAVTPGGLVYYNQGHVKFYRFPDLKELTFKGVN